MLVDLGSELAVGALMEADCPTCHQALAPLETEGQGEPLDLPSTLEVLTNRVAGLKELERAYQARFERITTDLDAERTTAAELRRRVRSLKSAQVAPYDLPNVAQIAERLTLELRREGLETLRDTVATAQEGLSEAAELVQQRAQQLGDLNMAFSPDDLGKIESLNQRFRDQLVAYGFRSIPVEEISIQAETLKPSHDGFDLSFDLSASDMIRVKWAYLLSILEISIVTSTNHPGFLILDEPGQQQIDRTSFRELLRRAGHESAEAHQVVIATSESPEALDEMFEGEDAHVIDFGTDYVLRLSQSQDGAPYSGRLAVRDMDLLRSTWVARSRTTSGRSPGR